MTDSDPNKDRRKLDSIANDFRNQWTPDSRNDLENWLKKTDVSNRDTLLKLLLHVDIELRKKRDLTIEPSDFEGLGSVAVGIVEDLNSLWSFEQASFVPSPDSARHASTVLKSKSEFPRRVDNYELFRRLGAGGMGEVFLARHHKFRDRLYAIKLLKVNLVGKEALLRFENEIEVAGRLQHPNIVFATDAGNLNGEPYLVMEYVDGRDLQDLLKEKGSFPVPDACELIRLASTGLNHAYEKGFTHRDIKPANIMLSAEGEVKVLDMGLARLREQSKSMGLTQEGQFLGTPDYMAPEQWNESSSVGTSADIYSLGCSLFSLLTGRPPFYSANKSSIVAKMSAHVNDEIPDVCEARGDVPLELGKIIRKSLSKEPTERFSTPIEFADALAEFATGSNLKAYASPSNILVDVESKVPTHSRRLPEEETEGDRIPVTTKKDSVATRKTVSRKLLIGLGIVLTLGVVALIPLWANGFFGNKVDPQEQSAEKERGKTSAKSDEYLATNQVGTVELFAFRLSDDLKFQFDEINGDTVEGRVVYEGERSRIEVGFEQPVYFMVFAFTPAPGDGKVQLVWPEEPAEEPRMGDGFLFPAQPTDQLKIKTKGLNEIQSRVGTWKFSDGIGVHSFFVVSSANAIPSFENVKEKLLEIPWESADIKPRHWVVQQGTAYVDFVSTEHKSFLRGADPSSEYNLQAKIDLIKQVFPNSNVDGIVFNVEKSPN